MSDDPEPSRNISGGHDGGGAAVEFDRGSAETRAEEVVDRLGELYWQKSYGGQHAFVSLVRTILSQNTSDAASQPAHDRLMDQFDDQVDLAAALADAPTDGIVKAIRSAGLYNQKAAVIQRVAAHVRDEYGGADAFDRYVRTEDAHQVRDTLLQLKGVGPKTADCVLLFAGGRDGVFPVDTHVHRIYRRLGIAPPDADHEEVREVLEARMPPEKCGFGHTASIQFGREYCTARDPACLGGPEACPLYDLCDRVGVDVETGTTVDPADSTASP
ncbi:endonuclease III domain-containing protein [Halanaeroarchaeum sulfurireducens]|uniref:DNA-(Apurinic or apyrimidinic site) lyase / endonuclease III n=1 Tax=Halanaeroarchaeum sulfurireducens TaxID=1604004 RepID=A0A0F7P8W5_9EURY|nr:endonuclease III [Halanaeroarchaeum sulfurireducens]AKH97182.1 DNA-(apurinic or apyrimidinic site) lyase / endonuclease III [Halanaeroarchaeum sulfurireducens]